MAPESLLFANRALLPWLLGVLGLALLLVLWSYRPVAHPAWLRFLGPVLRVVGISLLLLCLLAPTLHGTRAEPGANWVYVVADNSQSLRLKNAGGTEDLASQVRHLISREGSAWLRQLERDFRVRRFLFDEQLRTTADMSELDFSGPSSALFSALRRIRDLRATQPVAAVLLFTDGQSTENLAEPPSLTGLPPTYPVVLRHDDRVRDVQVTKVAATETPFDDAPVTVQVESKASGYRGQRLIARLTGQGVQLEETSAPLADDTATASFRFQVHPTKSGLNCFRVAVVPEPERAAWENPATSSEATLTNNFRWVFAQRRATPFRILYVAGRPNWDYKFLHRALQDDDQLRLTGLIRVAKREPKFEFRGRTGETSNPLFRGFRGESDDEMARYDQPVLKVLLPPDAQTEPELRDGFPKKAEDLFAYDAVILDDLEAAFFTPAQMLLLSQFVVARGGGLLMLGGVDTFHHGGYDRTALEPLLPVYFGGAGADTNRAASGKLSLTREGWLQPWVRLHPHELAEKQRLESMPAFQIISPARGLKPGATAVEEIDSGKPRPQPALAVQRYGLGKTAALLVGDTWRWALQSEEGRDDWAKAWRQLIRWLVVDSLPRIELSIADTDLEDNAPPQVRALVRNERFEPLEDAQVHFELRTPPEVEALTSTNRSLRLSGEPDSAEAGVYTASFIPRAREVIAVHAFATNTATHAKAESALGWVNEQSNREFESLGFNREVLQTIARQSDGALLPAEDLTRFAEALPRRAAPAMIPTSKLAWHRVEMLLLGLGCFVLEWGLRRWKGFA